MAATRAKPRRVIELSDFLGVDFTSAETEVDPRRSPECVNMIAGKSGRPELRIGYSHIIEEGYRAEELSEYTGEAKGLHFHGDTLLLHTGRCYIAFDVWEESGLYRYNGRYFLLGEDSGRSQSFFMNGRTYLLDGTKYVCYGDDGFGEVEGFLPTTTIGRKPNGGGTSLEAVNLLTRRRINSFTTDGTAKVFTVDGEIDTDETVIARVSGEERSVTASGSTVTFEEAPPDDGGVDSVVIEFTALGENRREVVEKCRICSVYGAGNPTRVFISGNSGYPSTDWYSGLYDPEYFPDNSYTEIGTQDSAIMGYLKQYGGQIIVKEDKDGRSGLYLRQAEVGEMALADGSVVQSFYFTLSEGVQGIGAVSADCVLVAGGHPLFLSKSGLMSLETNSVTNQQSLKNTSVHVNKKLLSEDLKNACAAAMEDKLYIAVDGRVYVALTDSCGSEGFEWFLWDNIPAEAIAGHEGKLFFAAGAEVYSQNSVADMGMNAYNDLGKPIAAEWWSPVFDGGESMSEKTVNARGTGVIFKPNIRTGAKLFIRTDRLPLTELGEYYGDIFTFADVDFNRFSFKTNEIAQIGISKRKIRNVHSFQIGIRHENNNDCLGLLGMTIDYTVGKSIKKQI